MTTTILTDEVNVHPVFAIFGDDEVRARRNDPITSHLAADRSSLHISESQAHIYELFIEFGEMTDSELNDRYQSVYVSRGWKPMVIPRRRRSDLSNKELIRDTGVRRANAHGSKEVVWGVA